MSMTRPTTYCTYCGKPNPETVDHIPPAGLFPKPRPSNLITVPSCTDCNAGASIDDEYLKIWLLLRHDISERRPGSTLRDSVFRALAKPRKRRMLNMLLGSMRRVAVHTPGGLFVGQVATYHVDLARFGKVADRTVKGLFFHHYERRLPETHDVRSYAESGLREINPTTQVSLSHLITSLRSRPSRKIGDRVFEYWFQATPEDPNSTAWLLRFYDSESFLCLTAPADGQVPAA